MNNSSLRSFEYKNDFLYIVIRQAPDEGPRSYSYCCGINISRFDPLCWGKSGICSNAAFKGLQLLRADVSAFARKKGIITKNAEYIDCKVMSPKGDGWYRETALLIEDVSSEAIKEIMEFSVRDLIQTILAVGAPDARVPEKLPDPSAMQAFLESLYVKDYKAAAPPPIARKRDQE